MANNDNDPNLNNKNPKTPNPIYFDHCNQYQQEATDVFSKIKSMREKNKSLNAENAKLHKKLVESREISNALHKELNEAIDGLMETKLLEEKLGRANEKIAEQQKEIKILKNGTRYRDGDKEDDLPSHGELEEQNFFLRVQLENLQEKFENKFAKLKEKVEEGNKELVVDNQTLKGRAESLFSENCGLKATIESLNQKLSTYESRLDDERRKSTRSNIDSRSVMNDLEDAIQQRDKLRTENNSLKGRLDQMGDNEAKLKSLQTKFSEANDHINILEDQVRAEKDLNYELKDCIDSMEDKLNDLVQQNDRNKKIDEDSKKIFNESNKVKEEILRIAYKVDRLNQKIFAKEVLADRLRAYGNEQVTRESGIYDGAVFKGVNGCLDTITSKVDNIISEHTDLKKSNNIYISTFKEKDAENKHLNEESEQLKHNLMASEYQLNDLKEEVSHLEDRCSELENEMRAQKDELVRSTTQTYETEIKRMEDKITRLTIEKNKQDLLCNKITNFVPDDSTKYLIENWVQTTLDLQELEERIVEAQLMTTHNDPRNPYKQPSTFIARGLEKQYEIDEIRVDIETKQKKKKELETKLLEAEEKFKGMAAELLSLQNEAERLKAMIKNIQAPDIMTSSMHSMRNRKVLERPQSSQLRKTTHNIFHDTMDKSKITSMLGNYSIAGPMTSKGKDYEFIREKLNGLKKKYNLNAKE